MAQYNWTRDPYWQNGSDLLEELRKKDQKIVIDLSALEKIVYDGDGPAYKLMEAMASIRDTEGDYGYRGAPRVLLALLANLHSNRKQPESR